MSLKVQFNHGPFAPGAEWLATLGAAADIVRCIDCGMVWGVRGRTNMNPGYVVFSSRPFGDNEPCNAPKEES